MGNSKTRHTHLVAGLTIFTLAGLTAWLLLLTTLVVWLAVVLHSLIASTAIVGGFFLLVAVVIYFTSIRAGIAHIRERFSTIYNVAHMVQTAYQWVSDKISLFFHHTSGK